VITIVIFVVTTKKNRKIHAEAEARRAEERAALEKEEKEKAEREFKLKVLTILKEGLEADKKGKLEEMIKSL
jgi:hypothetical protein